MECKMLEEGGVKNTGLEGLSVSSLKLKKETLL